MALAMTRPWRHPATSIFWLRKRVPDDLRPLLGRTEEKRSLGTRDPLEAKRRLAAALLELEQRWENLRAGPRSLTEREAHQIAARFHDAHLAEFQDNPSDAGDHVWDVSLGDTLWEDQCPPLVYDVHASPDEKDAAFKAFIGYTDPHWSKRSQMCHWCEARADEALAADGLIVDEKSRERLAKAIAVAMQRAGRALQQYAAGWYGDPIDAPRAEAAPVSRPSPQPKVKFAELLDGWAKETKPVKKTAYQWARVFDQFTRFLGHDDAQRVTVDDVVRWKGALVESGLKAKSIRDSRLAPVRAVLGWGAANRRLAQNVAERVTIDLKAKPSERRRGYTDEEAVLLLRDARTQKVAHRRWVPWLCAYSGARVAEICQLRVEDVREVEGIPSLHFTAGAGSLKNTASERLVPIHSAVLAEGFMDFVQSRKVGPLFSELKPDRFGSRGGNGTKILSRWVRELGITDTRVSPNHSWRHRLKTAARRHGLATDIVDAIVGHQRRTVADSYGEFPVSALQRELEKIPCTL
jgi:integrase